MPLERWLVSGMNPSQKKLLEYFYKRTFSNLQFIANAVYSELSQGYREMVERDREMYYNSDFYKKAYAAQMRRIAQNAGANTGIKDAQQALGHWVPAKRGTGDRNHITYSRPPQYDELDYEPIRLSEYVYDKALNLSKQYNDATTVTGMIFQMLISERWFYHEPHELAWFCYKHYKELNFQMRDYIPELIELFPAAMERALAHIDRGPTVQEHSIVLVCVVQNQKLSTFKIDTSKYPAHKVMIGKTVGDTFTLPGIAVEYVIKRID